MEKLTEWFPASQAPTVSGVYERDTWPRGPYSHYNKEMKFWGGWGRTVAIAQDNQSCPSVVQDAKWRGLVNKPLPQVDGTAQETSALATKD